MGRKKQAQFGKIMRRPRADGSVAWCARFRRRVNGEDVSEAKTFSSKSDAEDWLAEKALELRDGIIAPGSKEKTIAAAIDRYIAEADAGTLTGRAGSTKQLTTFDKTMLSFWREHLGDVEVRLLKRDQVRDLFPLLREQTSRTGRTHGETISNATINRYRAALQAVLSYCIDALGWIETNPLLRMPKLPEPPPDNDELIMRVVDNERLRKALLDACDASDEPDLGVFVRTAHMTGCRSGELERLRWRHVRLDDAKIDTTRQDKDRKGRVIDIPQALIELLREHKALREVLVADGSDLVFRSKTNPVRPIYYRKGWETARASVGLDDFELKWWRNVYVCTAIDSGMHQSEIKQQTGHKSTAMIDRYWKQRHKGISESKASALGAMFSTG